MSLRDRIASYQEVHDYKMTSRLPVIIVINGRGFTKLTSLLDKPYCNKFAEGMCAVMLKLCIEIEGVFFGFQHNDEIVLIARNDQTLETEAWYDNKIQKICSAASSMASILLKNYLNSTELNTMGEPIFLTQVLTVPNITEAINMAVYKQQQNFHTSIQFACFYELLKKYDKNTIKEMLVGLSIDEKIDLLSQECNIDFNEYPISFRRGVACYKFPKMMQDGSMKNKWTINTELPIFTKDQSFLNNIIKNG